MNKTSTCAIVDDNRYARTVVEHHLTSFSFLKLKGSYSDSLVAQNELSMRPVDLLFTDVYMPKLDGIMLVDSLPYAPKVIVCTGYERYAVQGFKIDAVDYLLKPISLHAFSKAVTKAAKLINMEIAFEKTANGEADSMCVKNVTTRMLENVQFDDILYIEAQRNYLKIMLLHREILVRMKLLEMAKQLPDNQFIQSHKGYIVAKNKIRKVNGAELHLHRSDVVIPISRNYLKNFI